jgi:hypothetical protein
MIPDDRRRDIQAAFDRCTADIDAAIAAVDQVHVADPAIARVLGHLAAGMIHLSEAVRIHFTFSE